MTRLAPFKVVLRRDNGAFLMARGAWRGPWHPIEDLPRWTRLYINLRDRKGVPADPKTRTKAQPGPYHDTYAECVVALEEAARKIKGAA